MAPRGFVLSAEHVVYLRSERLVMRRFTRDDDQLIVDLVEVDPDDPKRGTHPVTVEFAVADQPAHRPICRCSAASAMVM